MTGRSPVLTGSGGVSGTGTDGTVTPGVGIDTSGTGTGGAEGAGTDVVGVGLPEGGAGEVSLPLLGGTATALDAPGRTGGVDSPVESCPGAGFLAGR